MLSVTEAANLIGCSPQQVRTLIRGGKLKATSERSGVYLTRYFIAPAEARRYRDSKQAKGWPRGVKRKAS